MMLWAFGIFGIYFFTFAGLAGPASRLLRLSQTVTIGMLVMAAGLYMFSRLGAGASFASLMPAS